MAGVFFALVYCAVVTFRRWFGGSGRLAAVANPHAYGVYIVHVAVMGPIVLALLGLDVPGLVKYPILAAATWVASHFVAHAHARRIRKPLKTLTARMFASAGGP